ncbi:hypothetical protein L2E82_11158 [Cichorium intybus]|uniref:Uncharacterized protein n=1 Tax=Cichorium intybus TaxID=13427 RepID=A0ACB9GCK8_CICIN|nr:hypothetical protein L2E82_11158 [Cichorium intybus]
MAMSLSNSLFVKCEVKMEVEIVSKFEDDEDEFQSCCSDEEELEEIVELESRNSDSELVEFSVRMFFKGVSISEPGDKFGVSGIGVIMEGSNKVPVIQVQKRLEFFVVEEVAEYLALMDGLSEALRNNIKRVYAFTNSQNLFDQITNDSTLKNPLLMALKQRIQEHIKNLQHFSLKHVLDVNLEYPLQLAKVAIGIVHDAKDNKTLENCVLCCEDKLKSMMITLNCSHKFCSCCIKAYVDEKIRSSEVPVRCPIPKCRYYISTPEHKLFLPVASYTLLEEMDSGDVDFDCVAEDRRWRLWEEEDEEEENDENTLTPTSISDPSQQFEEWAWESFGSLSNTMDAYSDQERSQLALIQRFLAGGFSLGDHHTNSHEPPPLPPDDGGLYLDNTIKDLHQLPWLESFVSVISDNYYDEQTR